MRLLEKIKFSYAAASLALILFLALGLRLYGIDRADIVTDEALIAFRSIGYIDFFSSPYQTTPWEWFSKIPTWAHLSFHDHPPLVFVLQHISFLILGPTIFALRLPFVLAGVGCVWLIYLLGKKMFGSAAGLAAAAILAVNSYHVWISRIGLQESVVIFFVLLTIYLFLQALENNRHWLWGLTLGLAFLSKYSSLVLLPVIFGYPLFFYRTLFRNKNFWLALLLATVVFSPVIFYNVKLFAARGHFDLQLSYIFNQDVPEWRDLPGKQQAGDLGDRITGVLPALYQNFLPPMFSLLLAWVLYASFKVFAGIKKNRSLSALTNYRFEILLLILLASEILFFLLAGPSKRFVSMVAPVLALGVGYLFSQFRHRFKYLVLVGVLAIELFLVGNTLFVANAYGRPGVFYSDLRFESFAWGYNQLNAYIEKLLAGKFPAMTFPTKYEFLEKIKAKSLERSENLGYQPQAILLVYDTNMLDIGTFWPLHRQLVYGGWPVVTAETFLDQGQEFWNAQGVKEYYLFEALPGLLLQNSSLQPSTSTAEIVSELDDFEQEIIKRPDGREVFTVYHWHADNQGQDQ